MVDVANIARPYAKAIFELALQRNELTEWQQRLSNLALVTSDKDMQRIINNPQISKKEIVELFKGILGKDLNKEGENLLTLLFSRNRIKILAAIAKQYHRLLMEHERVIEVKVVSAFKLHPQQIEKLKYALARRLKCDVTINAVVDETILGGAKIYAKDLVIDGSLRGKINRLSEFMSS